MRGTLTERFWSKVEKTETCWLWKGATTPHGGYGVISKGKATEGNIRAHVLAYELTYGRVPEGMNVLHTCDNPPCVNPEHLFLGTQKVNVQDMMRKGRNGYVARYGEDHGGAKLSSAQVLEIKEELKKGTKQTHLAKIYGVTQEAISLIKTGRNWGWLT